MNQIRKDNSYKKISGSISSLKCRANQAGNAVWFGMISLKYQEVNVVRPHEYPPKKDSFHNLFFLLTKAYASYHILVNILRFGWGKLLMGKLRIKIFLFTIEKRAMDLSPQGFRCGG